MTQQSYRKSRSYSHLAPRSRAVTKHKTPAQVLHSWNREVKKSRTTIVVPCYNEALRLDVERIRQFIERTPDIELLMVDDGSDDGTALMLEDLAREFPDRITIHNMTHNQGKAEAVRQGMLHAMDQMPTPKYIGYLDADFATAPDELLQFHELLEYREDLQGVIGVRLRLAGHRIKREIHRHYLSKFFSLMASAVIGVRLRDTLCGAKLFRTGSALHSALHRPFISKWIFDVEILSRLSLYYERNSMPPLEWSIYEFPLEIWNDVGGSKYGIEDAWTSLWDLGQIFWENTWFGFRYRESPWWSFNFGRNRTGTKPLMEADEIDEVRAYEESQDQETDANQISAREETRAVHAHIDQQPAETSSIEDELAMIEETLSETANIDESEVETEEIVEALEDIQEEQQHDRHQKHHHKKHKHDRNRRSA